MTAKQIFSRLAMAYVAFLIVAYGGQYAFAGLLGWLMMQGIEVPLTMDMSLFLSQFCMYVLGFPVFYWLTRPTPAWHLPKGRRMTARTMLLVFVACAGSAYIGNMIGLAMMAVRDLAAGSYTMNPVTDLVEEASLGMTLILTVFVAPAMEELMFRKMLVDRLIPFGQRFAVVVSGISFGLFHGNFFQFFYACALGMIFAYVYSSTGKIRYNVILHMLLNLMGGVLPMALLESVYGGSLLAMALTALLPLWMGFSIIATIVMAVRFLPRLSWTKPWSGLSRGERARAFLLAPGVWVFLAVCIWTFL